MAGFGMIEPKPCTEASGLYSIRFGGECFKARVQNMAQAHQVAHFLCVMRGYQGEYEVTGIDPGTIRKDRRKDLAAEND